MRYINCSSCNNEQIPLNDSISVDGVVLCKACFSSLFTTPNLLKGKHVVSGIDQTICAACVKDFGDRQLPRHGSFPMCEDCSAKLEKRILPVWVKAFMVGVLLIVIFSFIWNWRFFQAREEIMKSNEAADKGDFKLATALMKSASLHASEVYELTMFSTYYEGIILLQEDKCEEALDKFIICKPMLPTEFNIDFFISQSKMGIAYNKKEYDSFLTAAQELLQRDTTNYMSIGAVASAYACLYAESGKDSLKSLATFHLERAAVGIQDTSVAEFVDRIKHRIATREIINRDEYIKRFPTGWSEK